MLEEEGAVVAGVHDNHGTHVDRQAIELVGRLRVIPARIFLEKLDPAVVAVRIDFDPFVLVMQGDDRRRSRRAFRSS